MTERECIQTNYCTPSFRIWIPITKSMDTQIDKHRRTHSSPPSFHYRSWYDEGSARLFLSCSFSARLFTGCPCRKKQMKSAILKTSHLCWLPLHPYSQKETLSYHNALPVPRWFAGLVLAIVVVLHLHVRLDEAEMILFLFDRELRIELRMPECEKREGEKVSKRGIESERGTEGTVIIFASQAGTTHKHIQTKFKCKYKFLLGNATTKKKVIHLEFFSFQHFV